SAGFIVPTVQPMLLIGPDRDFPTFVFDLNLTEHNSAVNTLIWRGWVLRLVAFRTDLRSLFVSLCRLAPSKFLAFYCIGKCLGKIRVQTISQIQDVLGQRL